jgi:hypothetical protein
VHKLLVKDFICCCADACRCQSICDCCCVAKLAAKGQDFVQPKDIKEVCRGKRVDWLVGERERLIAKLFLDGQKDWC